MDLITADLERANSRVAEIERRNERLRAEIESVRSGSESAERVRTLESQISEQQSEATRLLRSLELQKEEAARKEDEWNRTRKDAAAESEKARAELAGLREKVQHFSDYDEIKRELEIMKVSLSDGSSVMAAHG